MTVRTAMLQATLATIPDAAAVSPRTSVGIPPSSVDPDWHKMRVAVNGTIILRDFDPGADVVTGAPVAYVTTGGEPYVTMTGEPYVLVVG